MMFYHIVIMFYVIPWNNMEEASFTKVYRIQHGFELEREQKHKYFSLPDHQLAENLILVFGL